MYALKGDLIQNSEIAEYLIEYLLLWDVLF